MQRIDFAAEIGFHIFAFFREIEVGRDVLGAANEVCLGREHVFQALFLAHDLLRFLRVRPQVRVGGLFIYFNQLLPEFAGVKGTPGVRGLCAAMPSILVRIPESFCASAFDGSERKDDRP